MTAKTSDKVSSIAARYVNLKPQHLLALTATQKSLERTTDEVQSMAASCLSQDQHKGLRGLWRKVVG